MVRFGRPENKAWIRRRSFIAGTSTTHAIAFADHIKQSMVDFANLYNLDEFCVMPSCSTSKHRASQHALFFDISSASGMPVPKLSCKDCITLLALVYANVVWHTPLFFLKVAMLKHPLIEKFNFRNLRVPIELLSHIFSPLFVWDQQNFRRWEPCRNGNFSSKR